MSAPSHPDPAGTAAPAPRRSIGAIALPLLAVLYPFGVYFGMRRIPVPWFALALAALWLLRAPGLWREPGGRWMVLAALLYCLLLVVSGEAALLRWYPSLISLFLLAVFGSSLKFGPPLIERIARAREPQLPAAAVRYTRKVTWLWVGFFVFNASLSAALTLAAPLSWWTLYNGLLVYFIMGALLGGEWLLRRRLRRQA